MHSLLGVLYQQTILKAFKYKNIRTYCQVRSSHALAAPMPFVLYSDFKLANEEQAKRAVESMKIFEYGFGITTCKHGV